MAKAGVYKLKSPSGKIYIGQSNNIDRRLIEHKYNGTKKTTKLYSSIKKYGIKKHRLEILFLSDVQGERDQMEMFFISYFNAIKNGLNHMITDSPVGGFTGKKHTKEVVDGIKKRMKNVKPNWAIEKVKRKVYCEQLDVVFLSGADCAKSLGVSQPLVSMMLNNKRENKFKLSFV